MTAATPTKQPPYASIAFGVLGLLGFFSLFMTWFTSDDRGSVSGTGYASGTITLLAALACLGTFAAAAFVPNKQHRSWLLLSSTAALLAFMCSVAFALLAFAYAYALDGTFDEVATNPSMSKVPFVVFVGSIVALPVQIMAANEIEPQPPTPRWWDRFRSDNDEGRSSMLRPS